MVAGDAGLGGKRILVVGGSAGIGRGIVIAAASSGASVVAVGRDAAKLSELSRLRPGVLTIQADVRDAHRCHDLVTEAVGRLGGSSADFSEKMQLDGSKWAKVIKVAGIEQE